MAGIKISTAMLLFLLLVEYSPLASWITAPLENRFAAVHNLPSHIDGLIVLGGAVDPSTTFIRKLPTLNSEAERMTEFVRLAKLYPRAKLVFAGGSGSLHPPVFSEADVARMFFMQQGLDQKRITFESRSQNTYENVLFAKALVHPRRNETWFLISSAQDVPRCIAVFRKLQWSVIPRSAAYKSDAQDDQHLGSNLKSLDRSMHEWIGLLVYRLTGKSDELFPKPGE